MRRTDRLIMEQQLANNLPLMINITKRNQIMLATICGMCSIKNVKTFRRMLDKIALVASHRIYLARRSSEWTGGQLVKP